MSIRWIIPAPGREPKEKRYFHSDHTRSGLAFLRDGEFVFDDLYKEPRVVVASSERIATGAKPRPVIPYALEEQDTSEHVGKVEIIQARQRRNALPNPGAVQLVKDYVTDGMTVYAMTQKYNRSHVMIRKWLAKAGIEERQETEAVH